MNDAVIIGGSFAGLSVARQLSGHVAIVEKLPIGARQTSACAAPAQLVTAIGCSDAILSESSHLVIHTHGETVTCPLPEGYCTFDYERFCRLLLAQSDAEVVHAAAQRVDGDEVMTDRGTLRGRCIIDCSG